MLETAVIFDEEEKPPLFTERDEVEAGIEIQSQGEEQ